MPSKKTTAREMREARQKRMESAMRLVADLHDHDFRSLLIDSTQIDQHFYQRVIIDRSEMSGDVIEQVQGIADRHNARLQMITLRLDQTEHVRMALWPSGD